MMLPEQGEFSERQGRHSTRRRYRYDRQGLKRVYNRKDNNWNDSLIQITKEAFLPQGYPDSVSSDYLSYQLWDTLQAFCSSITGTLATMAVLKGVGVGDSTATPLAATITWMIKDGTGMLGRILFAWTYGTDLDCFSKQWRLMADLLNDLAILFNLLAPLFPDFFLLISCFASLSRAVVGVAGTATRAAFVQHQARRDNMADVAAKDGSQETLMNLVGLIVNLVITPMVAQSQLLIWLMFSVFTALHLWANYCAVAVLCMETFNKNRLHIVMEHYLRTGSVLSPKQANAREPLLTRISFRLSYNLGCSLSKALQTVSNTNHCIRSDKCCIILNQGGKSVSICLREKSERKDHLRAALTVEFADFICTSGLNGPVLSQYANKIHLGGGDAFGALKEAQSIIDTVYLELVSRLSAAGWVTSHVLLGAGEWRHSWSTIKDT